MNSPCFDPLQQNLHGLHAIEASAGTGKTFTITLLWLRLLLEEGLEVDRILVSTFTTAATAELRERLRQGLHQARVALAAQAAGAAPADHPVEQLCARLLAAGRSAADVDAQVARAQSAFDLAPISTIHGFCSAIIQRHSMELGSDPEAQMIEGNTTSLQQLVVDTLVRHAHRVVAKVQQCHDIAQGLANEPTLDESAIDLPALYGDGSDAALEAARARLAAMRPEAEQRLAAIAGRTQLARQGLQIMDALVQDEPGCYERKLTERQLEKVEEQYPEWLQAVEAVRQCHADFSRLLAVELVRTAREEYPQYKQQQGQRSFDDLLFQVHQALRSPQGQSLAAALRQRFQAVMVDECQDSDGMQIEVFQGIFTSQEQGGTQEPTRTFLVIGDPKQSIYRFRGADLASYRRLSQQAQRAPEMTTNWRSDEALVRAIDRLYQSNHPEFADSASGAAIPYVSVESACRETRIEDPDLAEGGSPEQQALVALWSDQQHKHWATYDIAQQCAAECHRLLSHDGVRIRDRHAPVMRRLQADDIAIIAANRKLLHQVGQALRRRGITYQFAGRSLGSVLESEEAQDILTWITAVSSCHEGGSMVLPALLNLYATPFYGGDAEDIHRLREDPLLQAQVADTCRDQATSLQRHGPLPTLLQMVHDAERLQRLMRDGQGERMLTNWRHVADLLQLEWASGHRQASSLAAALRRLMAAAKDHPEASMERLQSDLPAVQLVTTHSSKGLEYPVVFCPYLWQIPSPEDRSRKKAFATVRHPQGSRVALRESDSFDQALQQELRQEQEEQERLCYVALTRARHRCYIGMAAVPDGKGHSNGAQRSALARLLGVAAEEDTSTWPQIIAQHCLILSQMANLPSSSGPPPLPAIDLADALSWRLGNYMPPRSTSFSGLKHSSGDHALPYDRDDDASESARSDPGILHGLGSGVHLGNRIHDLLEDIIGNRQDVDAVLPDSDNPERSRLREALQQILDTSLPLPHGGSASLLQLQSQAIAEMHFLLPVDNLQPRQLSQALLCDPAVQANAARRGWAESIAAWSFARVEGFLQGYIDLSFCHQGLWYVADYKTNQLPNYDYDSCERAMLESAYFLQGRLYLLALHRHLRQHLQDYDPAEHLGGCCYWFVRGFDPQQPGRGVWAEGITPQAIAALDRLCSGASP